MLFALAFEWIGRLFVLIAIVIGIQLIITLFASAAGICCGTRARQETPPAYTYRLGTSVLGTVTQVREVRPRIHGTLNHRDYQIAITYQRQGETLTALFGMDTAGEPLMLTEGHRVKLRVFPYPLLETGQDARRRAQLAAGFLPEGTVHCRSIRGIPLDETATVMFEEDYPAYEAAEIQTYHAEEHRSAPNMLLYGIAAALCLCGITVFFYLCTL